MFSCNYFCTCKNICTRLHEYNWNVYSTPTRSRNYSTNSCEFLHILSFIIMVTYSKSHTREKWWPYVWKCGRELTNKGGKPGRLASIKYQYFISQLTGLHIDLHTNKSAIILLLQVLKRTVNIYMILNRQLFAFIHHYVHLFIIMYNRVWYIYKKD